MPKQRSPNRDEAKAIWEQSGGKITNREIAARLGEDEKKIAVWKQRDGWGKGNVVQQTKNVVQRISKKTAKKLAASVEENQELTDKQKDFCIHYVKWFNATKAYQLAFGCSYDSARAHGWELLQKVEVKEEISRLKELRNLDIMADGKDVVLLHMRIAFADITHYVEFGRAIVPVMGPFGPIYEGKGEDKTPVTKIVNDVRFLESETVDGQILAKVKQGRDGASVELADRQKSLSFLERYFELNPMDRHKKAYDNAKLRLDEARAGLTGKDGSEITDADKKLLQKVTKRLDGN